MLKKTWGEQLIGNFSFGLIFMLLALPGILVLVVGVTAQSVTLIVFAALYLYMRDGEAPEGFEAGALQAAIGHR